MVYSGDAEAGGEARPPKGQDWKRSVGVTLLVGTLLSLAMVGPPFTFLAFFIPLHPLVLTAAAATAAAAATSLYLSTFVPLSVHSHRFGVSFHPPALSSLNLYARTCTPSPPLATLLVISQW